MFWCRHVDYLTAMDGIVDAIMWIYLKNMEGSANAIMWIYLKAIEGECGCQPGFKKCAALWSRESSFVRCVINPRGMISNWLLHNYLLYDLAAWHAPYPLHTRTQGGGRGEGFNPCSSTPWPYPLLHPPPPPPPSHHNCSITGCTFYNIYHPPMQNNRSDIHEHKI